MIRTVKGYRDEWQGRIWDPEMNDKDGYDIQRWMTRMDMGYKDKWQRRIWDIEMNDKDGYGIQR